MKHGDTIFHDTQGLELGQLRKCETGSKSARRRWRGGIGAPVVNHRMEESSFPTPWVSCVGYRDCVNEFVIGRMKLIRGHTAKDLGENKVFYQGSQPFSQSYCKCPRLVGT